MVSKAHGTHKFNTYCRARNYKNTEKYSHNRKDIVPELSVFGCCGRKLLEIGLWSPVVRNSITLGTQRKRNVA